MVRPRRLKPAGQVFAGWRLSAGETPLPLVTRAPVWDVIDLAGAQTTSVILVEPPTDGAARRVVLTRIASAGLKAFILIAGKLRRMRPEDLIGSPLGEVDFARIRDVVAGRRVMVTGGGGSIGSELARRIATLEPERLTLLDSSEHNLYKIGLELPTAVQVLADIRDPRSIGRWFAKERPEIVFHAAALKQVPVVEAFASEGILTNVVGLQNVAEATRGVGADLIFVSTDKAVDPLAS